MYFPTILVDYILTLSVFTALRISFILLNPLETLHHSSHLWLTAFFFGLRLDLIITFYVVSIIHLTAKLTRLPFIRKAGLFVFLTIAIIFSFIDTHYYKFAKERIGYELFWQLSGNNNIPLTTYFSGYWLSIILILLTGIVLFFTIKKLPSINKKHYWVPTILALCVTFILARGGIRLKPIRTADATLYVSPEYIPYSNNTLLNIIESWSNPMIAPEFIKDNPTTSLTKNFSADTLATYNFVIIVLESFGKEYTGLNRGFTHTYTPFLNSLFSKSIVCHNAYANGLKSVDAVPAIFAGIPKLGPSSFINSSKSISKNSSLFLHLKELNYTSSFFHGADNNSMGFRSFLLSQGLDQYYGINEYPNKKTDYDGHWGIFDQPYFDYVADIISEQKQPFISGIFSLSSHHPYVLPDSLTRKFIKGDIPIHRSVQYTDFALQTFFEKVKTKPWFDNTIFIITADHSGENLLHSYRTPSGKYEVPMILYAPTIFEPNNFRNTVSHIDIPPTILDIVNSPKPINLLGESIFNNSKPRSVFHYDNNTYHSTQDSINIGINGKDVLFHYNKSNDINCLINLSGTDTATEQEFTQNIKQSVANYYYFLSKD